MDVTRKNQEAAYNDIIALLPQCDFYSLDLEMTGIRASVQQVKQRQRAIHAYSEALAQKKRELLLEAEAAAGAAGTNDGSAPIATGGDGVGDGNSGDEHDGCALPFRLAEASTANKEKIKRNPLIAHPQLQPPCESYDEKITAASTFSVVQMGLSLFFKKGTVVEMPAGMEPLGNEPAVTAGGDDEDQSSTAASSPTGFSSPTAATAKRTDRLHSSNRPVPPYSLPLTSSGRSLWLAVDDLFVEKNNNNNNTEKENSNNNNDNNNDNQTDSDGSANRKEWFAARGLEAQQLVATFIAAHVEAIEEVNDAFPSYLSSSASSTADGGNNNNNGNGNSGSVFASVIAIARLERLLNEAEKRNAATETTTANDAPPKATTPSLLCPFVSCASTSAAFTPELCFLLREALSKAKKYAAASPPLSSNKNNNNNNNNNSSASASASAAAAAGAIAAVPLPAVNGVPMEPADLISAKMNVLKAHTALFNQLTDAVQIRGILEQFGLMVAAATTTTDSSATTTTTTAAPFSSPSSASASQQQQLNARDIKWYPFAELFPKKALHCGRLVAVPEARGSRNNVSVSGNAFGAGARISISNSNAAIASSSSSNNCNNGVVNGGPMTSIVASASSVGSPLSPPASPAGGATEQQKHSGGDEKEYTIRAFSFYLFPNPTLDGSRNFCLNAATVGDFLANSSPISFDKWVKQGVHFVGKERMAEVRNGKALAFAKKELRTVNKKGSSEGSPMAQLKERCPSLTHTELGDLFKFLEKCRSYAAEHAAAKAAKKPLPPPLPMVFLKDEAFSEARRLFVELGLEKVGKTIQVSEKFLPKGANNKTTANANKGNNNAALLSASSSSAFDTAPSSSSPDSYLLGGNKLFAKWAELCENSGSCGTRVFEALTGCAAAPLPSSAINGISALADADAATASPSSIIGDKKNKTNNSNNVSALSVGALTDSLLFAPAAARQPAVVVQNGWSDLAFLLTTFFPASTPLDLPAFKTALHSLFPTIYDSRTLATLEQFNGFSSRGRLERMYLSFQQAYGRGVNISVPQRGQELFAADEKSGAAAAHDASYDSFITGSLFLYEKEALKDLLLPSLLPPTREGKKGKDKNEQGGEGKEEALVAKAEDELVRRFCNIVPCYGSMFSLLMSAPNKDVWLTTDLSKTPIIRLSFSNAADYARAPRALYSAQTKISGHLYRQGLPGVIQVPNNSEALYFVQSSATLFGNSTAAAETYKTSSYSFSSAFPSSSTRATDLISLAVSQALPLIEKDVGAKISVELMPISEAFALDGMSVKPYWPDMKR